MMALRHAAFFLIINFCQFAQAQEPVESVSTKASAVNAPANDYSELNTINVYGHEWMDPADLSEPTKLNKDELQKQKYTDVMRVLKQVPGVQMREEDAFGLRPNIGIRGTHPDRSKKIVFTEDGVLMAPAPYSAPAAYYTPSLLTTEGLEIYKGFTAVPWGPNSIGGSINYISKKFTDKPTAGAEFSYGSYQSLNAKVEGTQNIGRLQMATSLGHIQSAGFSKLPNNEDTGFDKNEVLFKFGFKEDKNNFTTLKLGYSDEVSKQSYLGTSLADIQTNPYDRYAASELDNMRWNHRRVALDHQYQINPNSYIKATTYINHFRRVWGRLDRFGDGTGLAPVLLDPGLSANAKYYQILKGQADSSNANENLVLANNQREFYSMGLQTNYFLTSKHNELQLGARYHGDEAIIDHTTTTFAMQGGRLQYQGLPGGVDARTTGRARALTLLLQDKLTMGAWSATLVGRYENIDFSRTDRVSNQSQTRNDNYFVPGLGVAYSFTPAFALRASVNKAVNVAGVNIYGQAKHEEATNYELGVRYQSNVSPIYVETNLFLNDYSNIAGICNVSEGCGNSNVNVQYNGGAAKIYGLELGAGYQARVRRWQFPLQLSMTVMNATFDNSFTSESPEWGVGIVEKGDRLPYVPRIQYNLNLGAQYRKFSSFLSFVYQGDMVDQSAQDGQITVASYGVVDINTEYQAFKNGGVFFKVDNVLDREYIVAARPFGFRPGRPLTFMAGLNYRF